MIAMDLAARLRQMWPALTADQRQVLLDLVWALAGPESALMAEIEELEDELAYDATEGERAAARPLDEVIAEIEARR
jgi:hypothetical protein